MVQTPEYSHVVLLCKRVQVCILNQTFGLGIEDMQSIVEYLFGAASFVPHGYCLMWRPDLVAIHAVSDVLIFLAYASIPAALVVFIKKRPEIEHRSTVVLFAGFILFCGLTHLVATFTLWQPMYGLQGLVKAATAMISVLTAIAIWPLLPKLLKIPSPAALQALNGDLAAANARLKHEITEHETTLEQLREMRQELEVRVENRTRELAVAYRDIARVNDDLSTFVHVASHDLKEPLRGIRNYAEMLEEDFGEKLDEQAAKDVRSISRLADRMNGLIESLREYSRAGMEEQNVEELDLNVTLKEVMDNLQPLLDETGAKIEVPEPLPTMHLARAHALTILQNLISNALKYSGPSPVVRVEAEDDGRGGVSIKVSDNGTGIPEDLSDDVFKMFRRIGSVDESDAENTRTGTGMGLAIVKRLVDRYNGTVRLGKSKDGGAEFALTFKDALGV